MDASVVESLWRPRKVIDVLPEDRAEGGDEPGGEPAVKFSYSGDEEAAWLCKGRRASTAAQDSRGHGQPRWFSVGGLATPAESVRHEKGFTLGVILTGEVRPKSDFSACNGSRSGEMNGEGRGKRINSTLKWISSDLI